MRIEDEMESLASDSIDSDYSQLPIPSRIDEAVQSLVRRYQTLDSAERHETRRRLKANSVWLLLGYGERMATHALRTGDVDAILDGLKALEMAYESADPRDIQMCLALLLDASSRCHACLDRCPKYDEPFESELGRFTKTSDRDGSIEVMGYTIVCNGQYGPSYKRTW